MEYSKKCPFCKESRLENNRLASLPTNETILFQNENIFVPVDISPICLGHILIVSNKHFLNFYEMPKNIKDDVIKIKENITRLYKEIYNTDVLFFEHGSAKSGHAGASIDHAHLHCVPYRVNIKDTLDEILGEPINCDILSSYNFKNEFSYIYLESKDIGKIIYKVDKLPSQFLREILSKKLDDDDYLWQEKCTSSKSINNLKQTITDLKGKISI